VEEIVRAIGLDNRIGKHYWYPGFGYGGSCFPKDVKELAAYSRAVGEGDNLFNKVSNLNENRIPRLMEEFAHQIDGWQGKTVAVLGLSFKPNTDDMREAPSIKVIDYLINHQAKVRGFDPKALEVAPLFIPDHQDISYHQTIEQAVAKADVIISLIEWPEIVSFDFASTKESTQKQWFIDARNQFDPEDITQDGYNYLGLGRRA
jgi:UDPglucose 6-dehydrogenase